MQSQELMELFDEIGNFELEKNKIKNYFIYDGINFWNSLRISFRLYYLNLSKTRTKSYIYNIKKIIQRKKIKVVNIAASPKIFLTKNPIIKWLINKVDLMLVEGVFGEKNIRKIGYKGKTQIIYPTFDKEKFEKVKVKKDEKIKIVTIARFDWKIKGLDILEEAIEDIDCEVSIIGKSNYKPKTNKMKMLGELKKEELLEIFRKTNLYIQSSRFETFSIATLEAAYSGLPVIVSDNCGVKEFVNEKYIFKNSKELNEILKQNNFENTFNFEKYEKTNKKIKIIF